MTAFETDLLSELIQRKQECLSQLKVMGRRQAEVVESGSMTDLLDVLAAKQRLLSRLEQTERELDPFRGQDPEQRRWRTPQLRQACADKLAQCATLLREIITQEKESERDLIRRRDQAAVRLQGAHRADEARCAYMNQTPADRGRARFTSDA